MWPSENKLAPVSEGIRGLLSELSGMASEHGAESHALPVGSDLPRKDLPAYKQDMIVRLAGIPARFRGLAIESLQEHAGNRAALRMGREYLSAEPARRRGLMLCGTVGTGKTHLIASIASDDARRGLAVLFRSVCDLLAEIKASYDEQSGENEAALLKKYASVDVLVLDDLGSERSSEWTRQVFYTIVNRRYNERRTTHVTTNLALGELGKAFDERLLSRLAEMCQVIALSGEDWRRKRGGG